MKKKELRNVIRKGKIRAAIRTINNHEYVKRVMGDKFVDWLKSKESPFDYDKSINEYNKAKRFLETIK